MKNNYKIPWETRAYVKKQLEDYKGNKRLLEKRKSYGGDTRELLLLSINIVRIERVLERLNKEDREAAELIFFDKYTWQGAEIAKGISKRAYYNAMNKVIYLTAREMDLI